MPEACWAGERGAAGVGRVLTLGVKRPRSGFRAGPSSCGELLGGPLAGSAVVRMSSVDTDVTETA